MSDQTRVALAEILAAHYWDSIDEVKIDGKWTWVVCCECGETPPIADGHKHIADAILASDALAAHVRAERAGALREAADEAEGPSRDLRDVGTCLSIALDLRDRADRIEASP